MRYEYLEPFINTTVQVLDSVIQTDITRGHYSLLRCDEIDYDIAIFIWLKGKKEGSIIVNMDTETALNVTNVMTGDVFTELSSYVLDTVSELANIIVGNATSALNDLGFDFILSPPIIAQKNFIVRKTNDLEVFQVPLLTDYGEITVNTALTTN